MIEKLKTTLQYMEEPSVFCYFEGIEYALSSKSRFCTFDEIERQLLIGTDVAKSSYFILEIVALFSFCTTEMIQFELEKRRIENVRRGEELIIPSSDRNAVNKALIQLCRFGLLRQFRYLPRSSNLNPTRNLVSVFCITEAGLETIRINLMFDQASYKEIFTTLNNPYEVFRRISCNWISQKLSVAKNVCKYIPFKKEYIAFLKIKEYIYSRVLFEINDKKILYLFEPIFFQVNPKFINNQRLYDELRRRLIILEGSYKTFIKKYDKVKIIFVVEDKDGLNEASKLVTKEFRILRRQIDTVIDVGGSVNSSTVPLLEDIFFTNQTAVFGNDQFLDSLIQIEQIQDEKIKIKIAEHL